MFSPVPPSNGVPSMVPLKEMVTRSPVSALAPSPLAAKVRFWSAMRLMASSTSASVTSATGFSTVKLLKSASCDRGHDLDRDGVGEIGFAGEDVLDRFFLRRHGDLGLGRQPEAALGEDLRIGVADGLVDGLRHHRAAIDLLEMADRHLARTEAVEADLVLEVDETRVRLGIEIRCGNADLEFVLQSLGEGFCDLHGVNLLPASSGLNGPDIVNLVDARP